eukprot:TRINITY_DN2459_c0_g1_i2.p1 TRINITY_DN2459_c0_g1~~TRINITY_DN2459_c0_g1_i2.p1  ORF type:complete len:338 (+),score=58.58 TRINITY_DN2459_c0_g1_i2:52-1065(+)
MKTFALLLVLLVAAAFGHSYEDFSFDQPRSFSSYMKRDASKQSQVPAADKKGVNYYFPKMEASTSHPEQVPFVSRLDLQQPANQMVTLSFNLTEMQQNQLIESGKNVILLGEMISMSLSGPGSESMEELKVLAMANYFDRQGNPMNRNSEALWTLECDDSVDCSNGREIEGRVAVNCHPDLAEVVQLSIFASSADDDDDYVDLSKATLNYSIAVGYVYGSCRFPLAGVLMATFWFLLFATCFWSISACFICCWYNKRKASKKVKKAQVTTHEKDEVPLIETTPVEPPTTPQPQIQYVPVYIPMPQQQQMPMHFFPQQQQQQNQQPYVPLYPAYTQHQ